MHVQSRQFGPLEVDPEQVLQFEEGLLGFPRLRRFAHLAPADSEPVEYLLALDEPALSFPLLNPYLLRPDYDFDLGAADRQALGLDPGGSVMVMCVATFGDRPEAATVNLLAPVVLNPATGRGRQVVLEGTPWPIAHPILGGDGS